MFSFALAGIVIYICQFLNVFSLTVEGTFRLVKVFSFNT